MNSVVPLKKKFASKVVLSCQAISCQIAEVARKAEDGRGPWIPSFVLACQVRSDPPGWEEFKVSICLGL